MDVVSHTFPYLINRTLASGIYLFIYLFYYFFFFLKKKYIYLFYLLF